MPTHANSSAAAPAASLTLNTVVTGCVVFLCVVACALIFLLPPDSLVVDLVYQGF
jgi:hypothetical protein